MWVGLWWCVWLSTAQSVDVDTCRYQDSHNVSATSVQPASKGGYISNHAVSDVPAACARSDRPWLITAQPGQRINLTLYNFTPLTPSDRRLLDSSSASLSSSHITSHHHQQQQHAWLTHSLSADTGHSHTGEYIAYVPSLPYYAHCQ